MKTKPQKWILGILAGIGFLASIFSAPGAVIFGITNVWKYNQTANLDGINWKATNYNDASWPSGPGLLYYETNALVAPRNTLLNFGRNTYYFRTRFQLTNALTNLVLTFSNRIDDGAIFYLNGKEIFERIRLSQAPAVIYYDTGGTSLPPSGDATEWDVFSIPATNAVLGENVLAGEVHQIDSSSDDIVFGSALSIAPVSVNRGPYLQMGTSSNIVVRWRTDLQTESVLRFGTNVSSLDSVVFDSGKTNDHEPTISNLIPDTKYFYSVGTTGEILAGGDTNYFFQTAPLPGTTKPVRIWVIGDSGTADTNARAVRDAYFAYTANRHTDVWLMLGDNAYLYGADYEYQAAVFAMYRDLLRQTVLWPTLGNHDTGQLTNFTSAYPYFKIFTLPTNGVAGGVASGTEHYYSFDYANIHFISLDSMTANRATNGAMANWLRADLNATTQFWKIAYWHHSPHSKGSHDSDDEIEMTEMRANFLPILEKGGVDLVFGGHSHVYERSFFLDGHYGLSATLTSNMILNASSGRETNVAGPYTKWASGPQAHQGTVYLVSGNAGATSGGALNHPAMFFSANVLGSVVLDIEGDRLNAKLLRETGAIQDQFTLVKRDVAFNGINFTGNAVQLSITNVASKKSNIVQASSSFSNWVSLSTNVVTSNRFQFTDTQATNFGQRFYRVNRLP